ncbi:Glutamyl-tRNA(Gln) amidotransferase subunit A [Hyphodiscus hymeniophilus]|uniref:Glutamyl-tRNA(Gln) amidotransferase subunit A n=1 Tax=Hyphodiscus hymeniophilus TaxID=353542 RepID=A0A9P6VR59_9HELO|nr:Glutamyl-tRNA(Gln) amidotransferase subunit A [Hyphodiscus hymeniophilus]
MISIDELTIDQVHADFKSGAYTCRQLVDAYIKRIERLDQVGPKLNAITIVSPLALGEADALDAYFKTHGAFVGALHGIPTIVKDQCDTKGLETAYGNISSRHVPLEDATLVRKLREAGAIILAKSTMPDFAASFNSTSSLSGETLNPYDTARETGGSSAGTGAAIAANYGLIGVGEDTGGSIRVPASFCNLVGLRPTVGLVSRSGLSPLVKTQDTPGPMTRTVRDAALMLDALVGYDPKDPYTAATSIAGPPIGGSYAANLSGGLISQARIGVLGCVFGPDSDVECAAVNKVVRKALSQLITGTTFVDVEIPNLSHYLDFTSTYMSRSRYDIDSFLSAHPIIKGLTLEGIHANKNFHRALPLFDKLATGVKHPYDDPSYAARLDERDDFQRIVIGIMAEHNLDAIAYPSVRIPAPTIQDVLGTRFSDSFPTNTIIGSQLRQPAISVPVGFTEAGLPVGLELLGIPYSEQKLLELAYGIELLTQARKAPVIG